MKIIVVKMAPAADVGGMAIACLQIMNGPSIHQKAIDTTVLMIRQNS